MEARLAVVLAAVVLIRLPFLQQPIQGDDVYYLAIARNARVDPLHPMQMGYTFQGARVSMAGHPHPPLNAYILAGLIHLFGGVRELPFHTVYLTFSLIAAAAMYRLARRFTAHPLLAALLFAAVPAFVVNGNSLEADLPFLAFWMAGFALYFEGNQKLAAGSLAVAALAAYQAVFAAPILAYHAWYRRRRSTGAWVAASAAPATLACWQVFQRMTSGRLPAGILAGYLSSYGFLGFEQKARSASALVVHLGWIVFPPAALWAPLWAWLPAPLAVAAALAVKGYLWWQRALLAASLVAGSAILTRWIRDLWRRRSSEDGILAAWGLVYFAGAVVVFYAGAARYLLPLAAPVVLTLVRVLPRPRLLWAAAAANLSLGLTLAASNYQYSERYRELARELQKSATGRPLWSGAEWGLRYYLEQSGAEPLDKEQPVYPGSVVVESELAGKIPFTSSGGRLRRISQAEIRSSLPVQTIGLDARAGYSSSGFGLLPFDLGRGVLDRISVSVLEKAEPQLSYLRMNDPAAAPQLLSGFYDVEDRAWRWMAGQAVAALKPAQTGASVFTISFFIPDAAPARRITVAVDGIEVADRAYAAPGRYLLSAPVKLPPGPACEVIISVDKTFQAPGDQRRLGIVVQEFGLR
jgi:hypothetical protein